MARVTAQTSTMEVSKMSKGELNSRFTVAEPSELGDQSPLQPSTTTKTTRNRPGRPRKQAEVKDKALSIEQVIQKAREELRGYFAKTNEIILRVGQAFENAGTKPSEICRKIKEAFADEIAADLIHPRTIENYCPGAWKIQTKPPKEDQKNAKRSFSESDASLATVRVEEAAIQITPRKDTTLQTVFMITEEKFAVVKQAIGQAIDQGKKRCYVSFNENKELDSIEADEPRVIEATIGE